MALLKLCPVESLEFTHCLSTGWKDGASEGPCASWDTPPSPQPPAPSPGSQQNYVGASLRQPSLEALS